MENSAKCSRLSLSTNGSASSMMTPAKLLIFWILIGGFSEECTALKEMRLYVPPAVIQGHKAILNCLFDLEGDKLYTVKWYRGVAEFYRYSPSEKNAIKTFKIKGFHVLENESNATQVVLKHVTKAISGKFSCEVTTDQPGFLTDMKTATMEVVEVPKLNPYITGIHSRYKLGDILKGNCTSEKSYPAANLTWFINGRQANSTSIHKYRREIDDKFTTSHSTIRIKVSSDSFKDGKLKIRCSASIYNVYHRSEERSIELDKRTHRSAVALSATTTTNFPMLIFQMPSSSYNTASILRSIPIPWIIAISYIFCR